MCLVCLSTLAWLNSRARPGSVDRRAIDRAWSLGGLVHVARSERRAASRVKGRVVVKLHKHWDRFGGDDGAFHCPSCREPILPCFPINKNRGLMAALRLNERLARRRR